MENKNIKVIIGLGFVIILTVVALVFIFRKPAQPQTQQKTISTEKKQQSQDKFGIITFTGQITTVSINKIEGVASDGSEFILNIDDSQRTNFFKQTNQEDGTVLVENIGLVNVPLNQDVDIQYDRKDNRLMLILVK